MEQKDLELLVYHYLLSLENSKLSEQIKIYDKLEKLVKSGLKIDPESDFMTNLSRDKPSLHKQILEWQSETLNASLCVSLNPR